MKNKNNAICGGYNYTQENTNNVKQPPEVKMNRTSFLCGNCNEDHNTSELRTQGQFFGQLTKLRK